jgi:hypothetical protein
LLKIFNYVLQFLYLGCQWKELPIDRDGEGRPEIHYTRIYTELPTCHYYKSAEVREKLAGIGSICSHVITRL